VVPELIEAKKLVGRLRPSGGHMRLCFYHAKTVMAFSLAPVLITSFGSNIRFEEKIFGGKWRLSKISANNDRSIKS